LSSYLRASHFYLSSRLTTNSLWSLLSIVALVLVRLSLYLKVFHFYFGMYKLNIDNYLSILVTIIITFIWVLAYLFKLNIIFLDLPFTFQVGCLPSTSNQYSKLVISCRQVLFFSSNLHGFFNYYVICTFIYCIYVASIG
jgi:hypothetical protein